MDFLLSKEHQMAQQLFRDFTVNEVKPIAQEVDENERFPQETVDKMIKYGFLGMPFPKEYGGQGCDALTYAIAMEEIAKACATTSVILGAHISLCTEPIFKFGNEEQKQKYAVPLIKGEKLGAFGLTEPNAGSDSSAQQTKAVLDGDNYILNGTKIFITNGGKADVYVILAMTDKSKGNRGISAFIVEKDFPGFSIGTKELKLGIRGSSTTELVFENCIVPKENLLGKEGQGFKIAMQTLDNGRVGIAAQAVGIAQGAIDATIAYVQERKQFGKPLAALQNTQFTIAEMQTRTDAARLLMYRVADYKMRGLPLTQVASMAKLFASENASWVANRAVQMLGGYGYMREYDVERMMRDAKITEIYEGTSEIQKLVIAGSLLK